MKFGSYYLYLLVCTVVRATPRPGRTKVRSGRVHIGKVNRRLRPKLSRRETYKLRVQRTLELPISIPIRARSTSVDDVTSPLPGSLSNQWHLARPPVADRGRKQQPLKHILARATVRTRAHPPRTATKALGIMETAEAIRVASRGRVQEHLDHKADEVARLVQAARHYLRAPR